MLRHLSAVAAFAAGACVFASPASAVRPVEGPQQVVVTNTAENPVVATLVGTPSVDVGSPTVKLDPTANTVRVENAPPAPPAPPVPFQIVDTFTTGPDDADCFVVPVPADQTATIQNISVLGNGTDVQNSVWLLRLRSGSLTVASYSIPMTGTGTVLRGQLPTLIHAGRVGAETHELQVCALGPDGIIVRLVVTGVLQPAA